LQKKLGIKPGDEIKLSELDSAISWANQNPFRQVQIALDTINKPVGLVDLDLSIKESRPITASISFSNAINSPIGNSSYTGSFQYGNLWGIDHELTYQYSTNNTPKYDQSHSFSYKAPFLARSFLRADVAYSLVYPQSLFGFKGLNEKAKNTVVDLKYIKPITKGNWSYDFSLGIDYKQVNTNLFFGELSQPISTYDIAQLVIGSTIQRKDTKGSWSAGMSLNLSPGGVNMRNTEKSFNFTNSGSITGRSSLYEYGRLILARDTLLPWGVDFVSRIQLQISSTNLQGSEQLLIGGGATVRGYGQSFSGDQGWVINQEIRSKYFQGHFPFTNKNPRSQLFTQFVAFWDYGQATYKHPAITDVTLPGLMGTGVGIRGSILGKFSMGSDLSWPIKSLTYRDSHTTKGTFWATLAY